ncbi:MAG: histidine kinase [Nostoc sp.]
MTTLFGGLGTGDWGLGIGEDEEAGKEELITNAPCPMPHAPCPMPHSPL